MVKKLLYVVSVLIVSGCSIRISCAEVPVGSGYCYNHTSSTRSVKTDFDHVHRNDSLAKDSVTYTFQAAQSTTANVSSSVTFDAMVAKVGVATQVGLGVTTTKAHSITWQIPARSVYRLRAGSRWMKVVGIEEYMNPYGIVTRSKMVIGSWTYQTWSDKVKQR